MKFTIKRPDIFPVGTTVKISPASNWAQADLPRSGAPKGSPTTEGVVGSDGSVTVEGLTANVHYVASGEVSSAWRHVDFVTTSAPSTGSVELGVAGEAGKALKADDATTVDARTPTKHASTHKTAGSDALTASDIGAASAAALTTETTRAEAAEVLKEVLTNKDTDVALAANSDTKYPSQKAIRAFAETRMPSSYRDHGLTACSLNDPASANTTLAPEAGKPTYVKVPVRKTTNFSTVRLVVSKAASAEADKGFVGVFDSEGKRLGVSAETSASFESLGEKAITIVADGGKSLTVEGSATAYVYVGILLGTQGVTTCEVRTGSSTSTVPNFALAANGISLRCGTLGTGKSELPTEFKVSELAAIGGPILVGA